MPLAAGAYRAGPDTGSLVVRTLREGAAARAGHDLVLEVTRWEAAVQLAGDLADSTIALSADPASLVVREASGGVKPLSDGDREQIDGVIRGKVLRDRPIAFRSTGVRPSAGGLHVEGELGLAGGTHPVTVRVELRSDGTVSAAVPLDQTDWGIRPYRALMGALRVRDRVEVTVETRLVGTPGTEPGG
jgi:polyisoprenoid-binding protein YceI